ncbi:hypothetical protein Q5424_09365 [Conexibacter sp. JD483]|uniref:hypothetical protein n=1 Tax=unclassified Conexibacter TaxID=2627773 RepID=UPI0027293875|nr:MULTISPECIES: hypothetical protein [unclassified Conexibacter]MDO8187215.1 hypothetical protein [Conexibacter sp. CPCC 205706]MDO8199312.1 hypothetical protein [Conexibacter sp. CPCC 205762]MDR9369287.1 hypothetical protein [Conexibacter sp. JD483]
MSALRRTLPTGRSVATPLALEARVSNPDPDELTVTIDDFDGSQLARHGWPVVSWPAAANALPARGDRCLVVKSEIGRVWVVAGDWSGAALKWRALTLGSSWSAEASSPTPAFAKSPTGWVMLRGLLTSSNPRGGQQLANALPDGFQPPTRRSFLAFAGGSVTARVDVLADGSVMTGPISSPPANAIVTLDGIGYWAED